MSSRYVIGIDLGTTNTVLSYVDSEAGDDAQVRLLSIPQVVSPNTVESREALPSFLYLAAGPEFSSGALDLPWAQGRNYCAGLLARQQGGAVPSRLVASAKSWLCHAGVDRSAPILPWQAPDEVAKLSPLDASARYLEHLRDAWNEEMAKSDPFNSLEGQEVFLTVPASFDAAARDMTMSAARRAGLTNVTLLEEPQAAFYAWIANCGETWREQLEVGDTVLVADIGGGTTDFTLITVNDDDGQLSLERIAVGEHILLGGDNMDLTLAMVVSQRLSDKGHGLDPWQSRSLWYACRDGKEKLLSNPALESTPVTVLGRGSKVIGGTITTELNRADVDTVLLEGFFPECEIGDQPKLASGGGLQELGLPYASDAAVTRHLSRFLSRHADKSAGETFIKPTAILFNGGVMKAPTLQARFQEVLARWVSQDGESKLRQLPSADLDLAVARGAAYYGLVRRGKGVRIRGGVARSYYVGIESAMPAVPGLVAPLKALCVVPFGMEEGTEGDVESREFGMVVGQPVEFRFLSSTTRKDDPMGTLLDRWQEGEIVELMPIHTELADEDEETTTIPVRLHSRVTELGTLDLDLRARDGRSWKLEYQVRETR